MVKLPEIPHDKYMNINITLVELYRQKDLQHLRNLIESRMMEAMIDELEAKEIEWRQ